MSSALAARGDEPAIASVGATRHRRSPEDPCDRCEDDLDDYERHRSAAVGWSVGVTLGALLFFPAAFACLPGEIVQMNKANDALGEAVETYNRR